MTGRAARSARALGAGGLTLVLALGSCSEAPSPSEPVDDPEPPVEDTLPIPLAGGAITVFNTTGEAYDLAAPTLLGDRLQGHHDGRLGFEGDFKPSPDTIDFGLGPVYNEPGCERCHTRSSRTRGIRLLRFSDVGEAPDGGPMPLAGFGTQLQDRAISGFVEEGRLEIDWTETEDSYPDGTTYSLRSPVATVTDAYAPFNPAYRTVRAPRPVFGLGLLEAVPDAALLALADPSDTDGDGVSGRPNMVWDIRAEAEAIGRFGWKASQPTLEQQTDAAYVHDMGVTTSLFPVEASAGQPQDDGLDDDPELDDESVADVVFFMRTLGVPARRDVNDDEVRHGEALFDSIGCAGCHVPSLSSGTVAGVPEISGQTFFPYTDLLLHDMGAGLADGRPDFDADGQEWRTPPLWGLGLADSIMVATQYLHDGRARTVEEAILWHGGEAQGALDRFKALTSASRAAVLRFLDSL